MKYQSKPFRPRRQNESAAKMLPRVEKRLKQIQVEISNWITMPANYGIEMTHRLEEEKQIFPAVKDLLLKEIVERNKQAVLL